MASKATPDPVLIAAYLDDALDEDLDIARRSSDPPKRLAAFHLQQAAEKLTKAVRLHRGLHLTTDHNIRALVAELQPDDPWRAKLAVLEDLSAYATAHRYPTPSGKRKPGLPTDAILKWADIISALIAEARTSLLPAKK